MKMTEFKKYPSIENHYQNKFINHFIDQIGSKIIKEYYIVREKLDGANIQLVFSPNQKIKVGKRTSYLEDGDKFFDIWNTLERYKELLNFYQSRVDAEGYTLRMYGEIYGRGINDRIDYGKEKQIAIFDIMVDDNLLCQSALNYHLENDGFRHLLPKTYGIFSSLEQALNTELPNNIEGAVIQPLDKVYFSSSGSRFIIKKKREDFKDGNRDRKIAPVSATTSPLNLAFRSFINENRIKDLFSKHGEIERPQQIPDYIKLILDDAKIDFLKAYNINELVPDMDKNKEKEIYNVGSSIITILKKYL